MNKKVISLLFFVVPVFYFSIAVDAVEIFDKPPSGYFYIKSVQAVAENAGYWDQPGLPDNYDNGVKLSLNIKDGNKDQQYRFMNAGEGYFYIESKNGGLADVSGNRRENGNSVMMWRGHGGSNQLFRFRHLGDGRWKIYAKNGAVVCAEKDSVNSSKVQIWEDHEGAWMEWSFVDAKNGIKYVPPGSPKK